MKKLLWIVPLLMLSVFSTIGYAQATGPQCNPCTATWTDPDLTITGFKLYLYTSPTGTPVVKDIGKPSPLTANLSTNFTLTGGVQYYLAVTAYNIVGESAQSTQTPFLYVAGVPAVPGNVVITK